jgi:hypothetical protein
MMFRIVFWDVLLCKIIVDQGWWRQYAPLKRRSTIILHGSISQKTILNTIEFIYIFVILDSLASNEIAIG